MKKILSILLSLAMLLSITAGMNLTAYADTVGGSCGPNVFCGSTNLREVHFGSGMQKGG